MPETSSDSMPSPLRCLIGAIIAGILAFALYNLTSSIAASFAAKGLPTGNITTVNIAIAVRTLVIGMATLATGIFGLAAIGLLGLGLQLLIRKPSGE